MLAKPVVVLINLLLLILYPAAWLAPLARAGFLPFFSGNEITIFGGVRNLWQSDASLAILVALFAVVIPYAKTLAIAAVHFGRLDPRALPVVEIIGKLSMADVFLIALYIVLVKGVGIGHVVSAWGLWLFTGCVLVSLWVGFETNRKIDANI
jgi:uncharacterized paraquat-inducible protein A